MAKCSKFGRRDQIFPPLSAPLVLVGTATLVYQPIPTERLDYCILTVGTGWYSCDVEPQNHIFVTNQYQLKMYILHRMVGHGW